MYYWSWYIFISLNALHNKLAFSLINPIPNSISSKIPSNSYHNYSISMYDSSPSTHHHYLNLIKNRHTSYHFPTN